MALLADRGIDYWFANAGTDLAPGVETLAKARLPGTRVPTPITRLHENTAMRMAIGYFLVTGRPQAGIVHVNVGAANGMNGLLNAAKSPHQPITFLDSISNYQKAVECADGSGEKVTDSNEMLPALERALKAVTVEKRQAVINIICSA